MRPGVQEGGSRIQKRQPTDEAEAASTLGERLHQRLEREILDRSLPPGTRLDEQEVAARFGVSRTPVREAFRQLAATGLLELRGRQGATVATIGLHTLLEMFQVMAELEGLCARLAARRIGSRALDRLNALHAELEQAADSDPDEFYEVNRRFHEAIYEAAQNGFLAQQTRALRNRVAPYRRQVTHMPGRVRATLQEHAAIIRALAAHDAEAAHAAMRDHVNLLGDSLADFIAAMA